jgi:hypothetical protein
VLYWDKYLEERVFLNHKGEDTVQIQRLGRSTFPYFEFIQRQEFDQRYEKFRDR